MSITDGLQVPAIPLLDVVCSDGAVVPAQNGLILLNFGVMMGSVSRNALAISVSQPLIVNWKLE